MEIKRLSVGPRHHFFGYYGINPWDRGARYHLALETDFHTHRPLPGDVARVGLICRETHEFIPHAETSAFNLQQGSMMHWITGGEMGGDAGATTEFTFNDWENGSLVSRALNPTTGGVRTIRGAIAAVSPAAQVQCHLKKAALHNSRSSHSEPETISTPFMLPVD